MKTVVIQRVSGTGVPVRGNDIDTDRIIPARFLKSVTFDGLGAHAFEDDIAALNAKGSVHPFRNEKYAGAAVLVSNSNFGCGSSREHAPQSLNRWGILAIIAESYSEIFFGNCVSLGIPCFTGSHEIVEQILGWIEANPRREMILDVAETTVNLDGTVLALSLPVGARGQFLDGTWNARTQLLANLDKVRDVAATLSYFSDYQ
ncbi:MAG: isopropylmalate isomerase [Deltaproteobacteria bacterium]|nr:isopropylmalate isomerase [Deltaproteobacteria bacterium]MBN2674163.1 isopropylmalate isomerase [Deltaproteobacteria bacterium]